MTGLSVLLQLSLLFLFARGDDTHDHDTDTDMDEMSMDTDTMDHDHDHDHDTESMDMDDIDTDGAPTIAVLELLSDDIRDLIDNVTTATDDDKPLLATLVRLPFHDCVGGCDGCINMMDEDNAGLGYAIDAVEMLYQSTWKDYMSRADFWAFAGTFSWLYGIELGAGEEGHGGHHEDGEAPDITYYWGRTDCESDTAPYYMQSNPMPSAKAGLEATLAYFEDTFGFDTRQTVTIMGAHSLGKATEANSGFDGQWVAVKNAFDHMFYVDMMNANMEVGWVQDPDSTQWEHLCMDGNQSSCDMYMADQRGLMFNSDMTLLKELDLDEDGFSACDYDADSDIACPDAETASIVAEFAASNALFLTEFAPVWTIMVTTLADGGSMEDLYEVTDCSELPVNLDMCNDSGTISLYAKSSILSFFMLLTSAIAFL